MPIPVETGSRVNGNFEGKDALSVAGAVKLNQFLQVNAGVGVGVTDNVVGARAGVRIGW